MPVSSVEKYRIDGRQRSRTSMVRTGSQLEREAGGAEADPEDASERVSALERIVIEAIDQADAETGYRVWQASYRLTDVG